MKVRAGEYVFRMQAIVLIKKEKAGVLIDLQVIYNRMYQIVQPLQGRMSFCYMCYKHLNASD